MEVVLQKCQQCGSQEVRNMLVREPGRAQMVYVRCASCDTLVARYRLLDYYHHGKGLESFLRSAGSAAGESGRDAMTEFQQVQGEAVEGFEQARRILDELSPP
jgi:hypothetical protein